MRPLPQSPRHGSQDTRELYLRGLKETRRPARVHVIEEAWKRIVFVWITSSVTLTASKDLLGVKADGCEANYSLSPVTEFKKVWIIIQRFKVDLAPSSVIFFDRSRRIRFLLVSFSEVPFRILSGSICNFS